MDREARRGGPAGRRPASSLALLTLLFCLTLLLICRVSPVLGAPAEPDLPYSVSLMTRYGDLTKAQKELFPKVYEALRRNEDRISLPRNTRYADAQAVMTCIREDCPELCNLSNRYTINYYRLSPDIATEIYPEYLARPETVDELLRTARALVTDITGDALTRELQIYDLLIERCGYEETANGHTAYGAIVEGRAVCEGYARAYALLLRLSGIPAGVIIGWANSVSGSEEHAWNLVGIGEYTLFCDPTWDDALNSPENRHSYFNVPELPTHRPDQPVKSVSLTYGLTWQALNGALIAPGAEQEETVRILLEQLEAGHNGNIRFEAEEDYRDFTENFEEILRILYNRTRTMECLYSFKEDQRCIWIQMK